jgi:tetratricopeptide (TPR) repeat protein
MINISTFICHFNPGTLKKNQITRDNSLYRYSALFVILIPFILYISALRLGFVYFDDDILIMDNYEKISHLSNLGRAFRTDAFFASLSPYYRPLMNVSFMVDAGLGGKSPGMYHLSNVIYHTLACFSLFWLLGLMGFSKPKTLVGTLFFAVHPMMGHAVLWIPARGDLLVTLFGLLAFSLFIRYLQSNQVKYLLIHGVCLAGAIFSKESAVFLPVLFFCWLLIKKEVFKQRNLWLIGLWLIILSGWYYLRVISIDHNDDGQIGVAAILRNLAFFPEAVSRFFLPFMLPVTPVFSLFFTLAGILAFILLSVFVFRQRKQLSFPVMLFGAAWFLGFCFPNMFVRLGSANDSFEYLNHRTYLPYAGLLILLLSLIPEKWFELRTKPYNFILGGLLVLLSVVSVAQQNKYENAQSYWGSAIQYAPGKAWFHYFMGRYYFKQKDYAQFGKYLRVADSLKSYPEFQYNLGMVALIDQKDYELAYRFFTDAFKGGYGGEEARANFTGLCTEYSSELYKKGSFTEAIKICEEGLNNDPMNGVAAYNLGLYLINNGEKQRAASMWRRAIRLKPDLTEAYRGLCLYYQFDMKKADSAAWFAREFNNHGGTGNLISPQGN